jgi:hypothetical protein
VLVKYLFNAATQQCNENRRVAASPRAIFIELTFHAATLRRNEGIIKTLPDNYKLLTIL